METVTIRVALAGQPNVGKSSLLNALGDAKLKTGNFSGVTVEKSEVLLRHCDEVRCKSYEIRFIDLPGAYSLEEYTTEERVTKRFLQEDNYDLILNVVDATHLQRNLIFTAELMELGKKMLVALNMMDEARAEGIVIDVAQLSSVLGVDVVPTAAVSKEGIDALKEAIVALYESEYTMPKIVYADPIEEEIARIVTFFEEKRYRCELPYRLVAIKILQEDEQIYKKLHDTPLWIELQPIVRDALAHIYIHYDSKDLKEIFATEHFAFAKGAALEVTQRKERKGKDITQRIDALLLNKYLGIPLFFFFMWALFQLTFSLGQIPADWIDTLFTHLAEGAKRWLGEGELASLVADGIISGVGAVILFLPNIVILFLGIALLETTGYMSRVSFLLDGFFHKFGLHGKSFIPLVTGFGCSVPAYMAARTLKSETDRLITLFIIGFMSCGARLPIYVLFAGAFFGTQKAGNILFLIYISGAMLGLLMAKALKLFVFKGEDEPFVMEMPKYRLPSLKLIWHTVYTQAASYLKKAGTFILLASVIVWFASNYPKANPPQGSSAPEAQAIALEQSYLGRTGKALEPFFAPLGFDWRMSVALFSGLAAKEVVVSTLGVLYALGEGANERNTQLQAKLKANISLPAAIAFIVFVMIYLPCFAASAVFAKEAGGWRYLLYLFVMTTVTAWFLSFLAYHITRFIIGV